MLIANVQTIRKFVLSIAFVIGMLMFAFGHSSLNRADSTHEMIEWVGIVAIAICILGRTWCTLYIGGRKIDHFVTVGPYSVSRNPLYFFSILGTAGAGAQLGSIVAGLIFGVLAWMVFYVVVLQEERVLMDRYAKEFATYNATVPRFLPNPRLWRDVPTLTVMPPKVLRTFADAMLFLLSVPLSEALENLQHIGLLPVLFRMP
jgi:protein-S-isoprenylcysteine O-methyltransferase Ste14